MLDTQYMTIKITNFISNNFYDYKLKSYCEIRQDYFFYFIYLFNIKIVFHLFRQNRQIMKMKQMKKK